MPVRFAYCVWFDTHGTSVYDPGPVGRYGAALSIDDKCSIQALPYAELARQLRADGQNLDLPESDLLKPDRKIKDLAGIVVDDEDARVRGSWRHDNKEKPYVGGGYLHDQNGGKGPRWAWFDAELTPGRTKCGSCAADLIEPWG